MAISEPILQELRKKYDPVILASADGQDYAFRVLTFKEFDLLAKLDKAEAEEEALLLSVLWPKNFDLDDIRAGVITQLANGVLSKSAFTSIKTGQTILEEKRESAASIRGLMKAFVLATQPSYKDEELDELTFYELADKVALAEQIIKLQQAVLGIEDQGIYLEVQDPEELAIQQAEMDRKLQAQQMKKLREGGKIAPDDPSILGTATADDPIARKLREAFGG